MKISWNWLSEFVDLSSFKTPEELAEKLTSRGLEVEGIDVQGRGLDHVVSAQIIEKKPHPEADRLSLCLVSTGSGPHLEIVCGAKNMKSGDRVVLAKIGAHLPNGLKIKKSKIRGAESNGMLCSEAELGLSEESDGIIILPPDTDLGKPITEVFGLNDVIFEISLTPNRGDCLSHLGIAREVAAALGKSVKKPSVKELDPKGSPISTALDAGPSGRQFLGCFIEGVTIGESPRWLARRLESVGVRPINNVVDSTNFVLMELGQPTHAYDADRLEGGQLSIRFAKKGETLPLLDDQEVRCTGEELVIADTKKAVALAGVMGGGNSQVLENTQNIFLECAEFDPTCVRKSAKFHQRHTEAAHRFERGIDSAGLQYALSRLAHLIVELAGGKIKGSIESRLEEFSSPTIAINPQEVSSFLGVEITAQSQKKILEDLECSVRVESETQWKVTVPSYRKDLKIFEDLAEEIARSLGYDQIPSTLPPITSPPTLYPKLKSGIHQSAEAKSSTEFSLLCRAKESLVLQGFSETLNYSFDRQSWLEAFGFSSAVKVLNPISEDQEYMVPSLLPGLLRQAVENWNHHFGSEVLPIRLFEIRPTFHPVEKESDSETGVNEKWRMSLLLSGNRFADALHSDQGGVDFYDLKGVFEGVARHLGTRGVRYRKGIEDPFYQNFFHPGKSSTICAGKGSIGVMGQIHPKFSGQLKLKSPLWLMELDWAELTRWSLQPIENRKFQSWSEFPPIERDFALLVKEGVDSDSLRQVALRAGKPIAKVVKIFDVYRGAQISQGMTSVAVRVIFSEGERSLRESEVEQVSEQILSKWKKELGVELR